MSYAIATAVALTWAGGASSQPPPEKETAGAGYAIGGLRRADLGELSDRMKQAGYPDFSHALFSIGGGGHIVLKRFVIGGEGYGFFPANPTIRSGDREVNIAGGMGLGRFGYAVVATGSFFLYPMIGVGFGGMTVQASRKGDVSFSDALSNPQREVSMTAGGVLLDAALGADYRILFSPGKPKTGFLIVGLRGGYTFVPYTTGWSSPAGDVSGGPKLGLDGPYGQLILGIGGTDM